MFAGVCVSEKSVINVVNRVVALVTAGVRNENQIFEDC